MTMPAGNQQTGNQVEVVDVRSGYVYGTASTADPLVLASDEGQLADIALREQASSGAYEWSVQIPAVVINQGTVTLFVQAADTGKNLAQVLLTVGESDPESIEARLRALETELLLVKAAMRRELRNR